MKILLIEHDAEIARFVRMELTHEGYEVQCASDGPGGLCAALENACDLILLAHVVAAVEQVALDLLKGAAFLEHPRGVEHL